MKIAWYTPFSIHSAIGLFSSDVLLALQALGHQVSLVRSELRTRDLELEKRHPFQGSEAWAESWDNNLESRQENFDLVVYNLGDHYPNHAWCLSHQRRVPGITILHDYSIHGLLNGWAQSNESLKKTYLQVLAEECDPSALDEYNAIDERNLLQEWFLSRVASHPVLRFAMHSTLGIVTHANFYKDACSQRIGCPVKAIPLAYRGQLSGEKLPITKPVGQRRLITIGHANSNKCYESIIRAIGSSAGLAHAWSFRVVGAITSEYQSYLSKLAITLPHQVNVEFTGRVDSESLKREIYLAQAVSCLRNPVLEGASASVIESMQSARPTIVSNAGCYLEIPDDCVFKILPGQEVSMLQRCLSEIQLDSRAASEKAERARRWALNRHRSDRYAEDFTAFANEVLYQQPVIETVDRIANYVAGWTAAVPAQWDARIERCIRDLFPGKTNKASGQISNRQAA